MKAESFHPDTAPVAVVEQALEEIFLYRDDFGIPIKGYKQAKGRLKRRGITFLATLEEKRSKWIETVALRVNEKTVTFRRFLESEEWTSWKGKPIHEIRVEFCRNINDVIREVAKCLRTALNNLMRRINKILHKNNTRFGKGRERYRRFHSARMCH